MNNTESKIKNHGDQRNKIWNSITSGYIFVDSIGSTSGTELSLDDIKKYRPHYVKAQWGFPVSDGTLQLIMDDGTNINALSLSLVQYINDNTEMGAMIMIGGAGYDWTKSIDDATKRTTLSDQIRDIVDKYNLFGVEIDFEPTGNANLGGAVLQVDWDNKMLFLDELSDKIHALQPHFLNDKFVYKKVSCAIGVDYNQGGIQTIGKESYQLADYLALGLTKVDYIMIMAYDLEFGDNNKLTSTSPIDEVTTTLRLAMETIPNANDRVTFGIASYSHYGKPTNISPINLSDLNSRGVKTITDKVRNTKSRISQLDPNFYYRGGGEMQYTNFGNGYDVLECDTTTMNIRRHIAENQNCKQVSVWSLSGNLWFDSYEEPTFLDILTN